MRTKLDREISRLQKNARNKLYRLRKKGATNLAEIDPREDASNMTRNEKRRYLNKLRKFNSRENAYVLQPNNVIAPKKLYETYKSEEKKTNKARTSLRKRIERKMHDAMGEAERIDALAWAASQVTSEGDTYVPSNVRFGDLKEQVNRFGFSTIERIKEAISGLRKVRKTIRSRNARYSNYRQGMANRARETYGGYADIANNIMVLTNEQMDYLHYYTDFDNLMSNFFYECEYTRGRYAATESQIDNYAEKVMELIRRADALFPGQRKVIVA